MAVNPPVNQFPKSATKSFKSFKITNSSISKKSQASSKVSAHPVFSAIPSKFRRSSVLLNSCVDSKIPAYPKTPPSSDISLMVSAFLSSPKVSLCSTEFLKYCIDSFPYLARDAAFNMYNPFDLRLYALKNDSFINKLLLISASTDFTLADLEEIYTCQKTSFPLDAVSNIVFNNPESLNFFYERDIFSVAACPNITPLMIENIISSTNLRVKNNRTALAELAINPWVSKDYRVQAVNILFRNRKNRISSATRIVFSVPFIDFNVSFRDFSSLLTNFKDNFLGLISWASGAYSLQSISSSYYDNRSISKNNIFNALTTADPLLPAPVNTGTRFPSAPFESVKLIAVPSESALKFVNKTINDPNISFVTKIATLLVFDLKYSSLNKNPRYKSSSLSVNSTNRYDRSNAVASFLFFREFFTSVSDWECFSSLAPAFEGEMLDLVSVVRNL